MINLFGAKKNVYSARFIDLHGTEHLDIYVNYVFPSFIEVKNLPYALHFFLSFA